MKRVGIRELRLKLSSYLKEVKKGEHVVVTERGQIIARLIPARQENEETKKKLLKMAADGLVLLPQQWSKPSGVPKRKKVKGAPFAEAVLEGRR